MYRKIGLYFLSLWLMFFLVIIITAKIPIYLEKDWEYVGSAKLLVDNVIPVLCLIALLIGAIAYYDFNYKLEGTQELAFRIAEIENIDYEHLTFLTTYIVPLVCFNFDNVRYQIVLLLLLCVIGMIYIRTDLFYANPTLAILRFRIYKISGEFINGTTRNNIILITRDQLVKNARVTYIKLDERIYYAKLVNNG